MLIASYFPDFQCTGSACEDSCCCVDWRITVDKDTYHRYKQNKHPALVKLFRDGIARTNITGPQAASEFGVLKQKNGHCCVFLDDEKLCLIQKTLGADWLSKVCASYPRIVKKLDEVHEATLTISCPEAARVILNRSEPITMVEQADNAKLIGYTRSEIVRGRGVAAGGANDIRALCIAILQARQYPLDARMTLLGEFIASLEQMVSTGQDAQVPALFNSAVAYLDGSRDYMVEFAAYRGSAPLKLQMLLSSIINLLGNKAPPRFKDCLADFNAGLGIDAAGAGKDVEVAYRAAYVKQGKDLLARNTSMFENYLVNFALNNQFPFGDLMTLNGLFDVYIRLALLYGMLKLMAVGMAGHTTIDNDLLIQLFQSFSRRADHSAFALQQLHDSVTARGWNNLPSIAMAILDE